MTKKVTKTTKNKSVNKKKTPKKNIQPKTKKKDIEVPVIRKINPTITKIVIVMFGILLIFSTYAWFSMNLNVKIRTFKLTVQRNSDFDISLDGINFDYTVEITKKSILDDLNQLYPSHNNQWNGLGFIPVSAKDLRSPNDSRLRFFETSGVLYKKKKTEDGFIYTSQLKEDQPREYNSILAFDVFIRNKTGSPVADRMYFHENTSIITLEDISEEMIGLVNSFRVALVKVGTVPRNAEPEEIQAISCNNDCEAIIYEPNSKNHTDLSIERAKKFDVELEDGFKFPTYAYVREGGPFYLKNLVSGSPNMETGYIELQDTITEEDFNTPLFDVPDGITKVRIYIWIEGQDIDSLETHSDGTEVDINLSFMKDTYGLSVFNDQ